MCRIEHLIGQRCRVGPATRRRAGVGGSRYRSRSAVVREASEDDMETRGQGNRLSGARYGYTVGMKTAVSIPDDIFARAERLASRERRTRSEVYATAIDEYLARHVRDEVTDRMNRVCDKVGESGDAFLDVAGRQVLDRVEW